MNDKGKIDIGGYQLHYHCMGEGSPTVVMEAGGGSPLDQWSLVQPQVAQFTRVFTYDRAGLGKSDEAPTPRTIQQMVIELHTLLENAGIERPYVLVGSSFGGFIVRLFASRYTQEVAAIILVDAGHEDYVTRQMALLLPEEKQAFLVQWQQLVATLPPSVQLEMRAYNNEDRAELFAVNRLPELPLVVITHGISDSSLFTGVPTHKIEASEKLWLELQNELVNLVPNGTHIIAEQSRHNIPQDQPELVIDAIRRAVEAARNQDKSCP